MPNIARSLSIAIGAALALAVLGPSAALAATPDAGVVTTRVQKNGPDNLCLAVTGAAGAQAFQTPCTTDQNQYWDFVGPFYVAQGGYYYQMRNAATGLCLISTGGTVGTPVVQQDCSTEDPPPNGQVWGMTSGDFQMIKSREHHLGIKVPGTATGTGAELAKFQQDISEISYRFLDAQPRW